MGLVCVTQKLIRLYIHATQSFTFDNPVIAKSWLMQCVLLTIVPSIQTEYQSQTYNFKVIIIKCLDYIAVNISYN